jgi:hypothetical protein
MALGTETQVVLTRELLAEEAAEAQAWADGSIDVAHILARMSVQQQALQLITELDIEHTEVRRVEQRRNDSSYVVYALTEEGVDYRDGGTQAENAASVVCARMRPVDRWTLRYGGAHGADARFTKLTAALMLLAAADVESRNRRMP